MCYFSQRDALVYRHNVTPSVNDSYDLLDLAVGVDVGSACSLSCSTSLCVTVRAYILKKHPVESFLARRGRITKPVDCGGGGPEKFVQR